MSTTSKSPKDILLTALSVGQVKLSELDETVTRAMGRKTYRKRVQVETVVSMIKRRLGNHVRARSRWGQVRELALVVLTHNLMILWCYILFYRARLTPLISAFDFPDSAIQS